MGAVSELCGYSYEGAFRLAAKIEDYWHRRGHPSVKSEPFKIGNWRFQSSSKIYEGDGEAYKVRWGVRSNLVNGLPPHGND